MFEGVRKPHRMKIQIHKDQAGAVNVLDARLTMAIAFLIPEDGLHDDVVDRLAVAARKGLIQALDDINRDDIRADLVTAMADARSARDAG